MRPCRCERVELPVLTPDQEATQVRLCVHPRLSLEASQVGGDGQPQHLGCHDDDAGDGRFRL